jgi:hypothetical protein
VVVSRIVSTITIARNPDEVFGYVTVPGRWPEWHPSSLAVSGCPPERSLEVGERCTEEFLVAGRHGSCEWAVVERIPGVRWTIATATQGGSATIAYDLAPAEGGTSFRRTLDYRMPNALLALLDRLVLRRRIEAESKEALRRLKARLESGGPG